MGYARVEGRWSAPADVAAPGARILVVGSLGSGVGLLIDVLLEVADRTGFEACRREAFGVCPGLSGGVSRSVIRFGSGNAEWETDRQGVDFVVAFDDDSARQCLPHLSASGQAIVLGPSMREGRRALDDPFPGERFPRCLDSRCQLLPARANESPCRRVARLLARLAGHFNWPEQVWREALARHVRPRERKTLVAVFDAACQATATRP